MKAAAYIDGESNQLMLIPESDFEKQLLDGFNEKTMSSRVADVYSCHGGWMRFERFDQLAGEPHNVIGGSRRCLLLTIQPELPTKPQDPAT